MPSSSGFLAEFLPRIGTTSIVLWGVRDPNFKYSGSSKTKKIIVEDKEDKKFDIVLPHGPGNVKLKNLVSIDASSYLLTLKSDDVQIDKASNDVLLMPQMKWSKRQLKNLSNFMLCCLKCGADIIDSHGCCKLNEMPSEFWMELMDYWHCHKPQNKSSGFYLLRKNSLRPCLNELLIGDSFFQALEETFTQKNITVTEDQAICCNCKETLGKRSSDSMLRIPKWKLSLKCNACHDDVFPPEYEIVSILLNCNKANSTRYVLLRCREDDKHLYIWLFAAGIGVTLPNGKTLRDCLKIFYSDTMPSNIGLKANVDEEQVDKLPLEKFIDVLETTNSILPLSKKSFATWKISYLPVATD